MENKVSLKSKLNVIRLALSKEMNKSGKNTYSKYDYFQLKDFMPRAIELMNDNGVYTEFWISKDKYELPSKKTTQVLETGESTIVEETNFEYKEFAHLKAYNLEDEDDYVEISKETANVALQAAQPIQNLGGKSTYMKRYMYMDLFEINENDAVEEETGKPVKAESVKTSATKPVVKAAKPVEEPKVEEPKVEEPKVEPVVEETKDTSELMSMTSKQELANYMASKGLDPRETIVGAAKELNKDVPYLLESDYDFIKSYVDKKVGGNN